MGASRFNGIRQTAAKTFLQHQPIHHQLNGVLFILLQLDGFRQIVEDSIHPDTGKALLPGILKDLLMLTFFGTNYRGQDDESGSLAQGFHPIYDLIDGLTGNFLAAAGFGLFFGGTAADTLWAGMVGIMIGLISHFFSSIRTNPFFTTITASFLMALSAYGLHAYGLTDSADAVIMGTVMLLVPGLLFTNAMRDIIYGDTNSGVNRIMQVFLVAAGIALGTASAWNTAEMLWGTPADQYLLSYTGTIQVLAAAVGCIGFTFMFNVHGHGAPLCILGGGLTWAVYLMATAWGGNDFVANFWAALFAGFFAEAMARVRKRPAISYLVISLLPLIPGGGIYRAVNYAVRGNMGMFADTAIHTGAVAGILAVGILMASTSVRLVNILKTQKK